MFSRYIVIFSFLCGCLCDDQPHVTTPLGEVAGTFKTSHDGKKFSAFEGIPFAKPPIGDRRFEEAEPVEPWKGVWQATFPTECVQADLFNLSKSPQEDCLHINVFVPREEPNSEERLDVIVHIHGGAYMYGSGHSFINPYFLMDRDVVFVTFNYRLGIFGFLSTEDDVVPGNNGLKDQVLALKWIQENIASFGGNPDSVTITGVSAGGASVHSHYFSELSRGLFHRGFSQSGVALNSFNIQEEPLTKAKILAQGVGCPISCNKCMVKCLKTRPFQHLLGQQGLFFAYGPIPLAPFAPVVEKDSKNAFFSDYPYRLLFQGKVNDVPWINSNTAHEGLMFFDFFKKDVERINNEWGDLAPYLLDFNYTLPRSQWKEISHKIKDFYLGKDEDINFEGNFLKSIDMFTDRIFLVDSESAVRLQAKINKSPVYFYYFNYPGDNDEMKFVNHAADSIYYYAPFFGKIPLTSRQLKLKDLLIDMLVAYAKTGTPTIKGVDWEPTQHDQLTYLNITSPEDIKLQTTDELTKRAFWRSLRFKENDNLEAVKEEL